jgi:hypothetical protein
VALPPTASTVIAWQPADSPPGRVNEIVVESSRVYATGVSSTLTPVTPINPEPSKTTDAPAAPDAGTATTDGASHVQRAILLAATPPAVPKSPPRYSIESSNANAKTSPEWE